MTARKILRGQQGVDKRSIHQVFSALQISLDVGDYAHIDLYCSRTVVDFAERAPKTVDPINNGIK